jgi:pseudouridylate synthase
MRGPVAVSPEVARALRARKPVVALETTLVTHGLPRAEGVEAALELEAEVRAGGAWPATIGVLEGRVRVGLGPEGIRRLAAAEGVVKLGLSNLAAEVTAGRPGSTTVAATMWAAHQAGIRVFATGGIGGVHRGAADTFDVSADLTALSRFPVAVVCAGAKAVLDLPKTVEALETLGVPILGLGTDRFPAFYRRDSGQSLDSSFQGLAALAAAVRAHFALGLATGIVVANPIPAEHELPRDRYESALERALTDAEREGVRGRAVTPFLLERMRALTEGQSVFSNRALLSSNARVAAALAVALVSSRSNPKARSGGKG